jgi:hypothetical protein
MKKSHWIIASIVFVIGIAVLAALAVREPEYEVVSREDGFQLREYAPLVVAETIVQGPFDAADEQAFPKLVPYIKGNNYGGRNIPMTPPVHQQAVTDTDAPAWRIQFSMPQEYQLPLLPKPVDESVTLRQLPTRLMAALRYGGDWSETNYLQHERELMQALSRSALEPVGTPMLARYNAPLIPWFMRRNEVLVEVRRR